MDIENFESGTEEDVHFEKVIGADIPPKSEKSIEKGNKAPVSDKNVPEETMDKKEKKLKKSVRRLNQQYEEIKKELEKWMEKEKQFLDLFAKKEEWSNDLKALIERSVHLKISGKSIEGLKKVLKKINLENKENAGSKKIRNRILKLEKKLGRIESKLA